MQSKSTTIATAHSEMFEGDVTRCQLVVVEGIDMGRATFVDDEPIVIGTDPGCGLVLTDTRVSQRHLQARREGAWFVVQDLDSRNGTLFEGSMITEARVMAGATFKLGHSFVRLQPQPQTLEVSPSQSRRCGELVGESLVMREVFAVIELIAPTQVTVLLEGDTGTGKELAARALHQASPRRSGPFVPIDCGALPTTLVESALFGHIKGAFTGAESRREGAFVRAHGGTLFLDELGHIPLEVQARLLRAVEERQIRPVGADREQAVDVRIIAAAQVDLDARVADGQFRPDLLYRLSVVRVKLPDLRERREDIAPIVNALLQRCGWQPSPIRGANLDRLMAHNWPGNVRELRNVIERAIALSPGAEQFDQLRLSINPTTQRHPLQIRTDMPFAEAKQQIVQAFEAAYLNDVFARVNGNISAMAREVQLDRKHLRTLLRRYGILQEP